MTSTRSLNPGTGKLLPRTERGCTAAVPAALTPGRPCPEACPCLCPCSCPCLRPCAAVAETLCRPSAVRCCRRESSLCAPWCGLPGALDRCLAPLGALGELRPSGSWLFVRAHGASGLGSIAPVVVAPVALSATSSTRAAARVAPTSAGSSTLTTTQRGRSFQARMGAYRRTPGTTGPWLLRDFLTSRWDHTCHRTSACSS